MEKEGRKTAKRDRKANFSEAEEMLLVKEILIHKDILLCNRANSSVTSWKADIWNSIAKKMSSLSSAGRDSKALRKKWQDMKKQALDAVRQEKECAPGIVPIRNPHINLTLEILGRNEDINDSVTMTIFPLKSEKPAEEEFPGIVRIQNSFHSSDGSVWQVPEKGHSGKAKSDNPMENGNDPEDNDHAPHTSCQVPQRNNHICQSSESVSQSNNHILRAILGIPQSNMLIPKASGNVPQAKNHISQSSENVLQSSNHIPQASGNIPQAKDNVPLSKNHLLQASISILETNNPISQSNSHIPQANSHVLQANSDYFKASADVSNVTVDNSKANDQVETNHHIPQTNIHEPKANGLVPPHYEYAHQYNDQVPQDIVCDTPEENSYLPENNLHVSSNNCQPSGDDCHVIIISEDAITAGQIPKDNTHIPSNNDHRKIVISEEDCQRLQDTSQLPEVVEQSAPMKKMVGKKRFSGNNIQDDLWIHWLQSEIDANEKRMACMDIYTEVMQLKKRKLELEIKTLGSN